MWDLIVSVPDHCLSFYFGRNDQFRKIIIRYKRTGNNMNIMRQTAFLVVNPITINHFVPLFNCPPAGRASNLKKAPA